MPLSKQQVDDLMRLIGLTEELEINCEQCLALVAEFAEQESCGTKVRQGLEAVRQHLSICGECQEEYEALRQTLDVAEPESDA